MRSVCGRQIDFIAVKNKVAELNDCLTYAVSAMANVAIISNMLKHSNIVPKFSKTINFTRQVIKYRQCVRVKCHTYDRTKGAYRAS